MASCIPSNPDITGIGVRAAIYAQNFFTLIPAARVLWDGKITRNEIDTMEEQSSTILVTAFALLFTTIIEARSKPGMNTFDVSAVLNLSWMNNTNVFIYFLLYTLHRLEHPERNKSQILQKELKRIFRNPVFWIGSLHLTLMGAVGVWVWSHPVTFGHSDPQCSIHVSVVLFGGRVALASKGLQVWSLFVYGGLLLMPGLNMILPSALIVLPVRLMRHLDLPVMKTPRWKAVVSVTPGFIILIVINIFFLISTEIALHDNQSLVGETVDPWTFGQILALMLLLVPAWNFVGILLERRDSRAKKIRDLVVGSINGDIAMAQELLNHQPEVTVKGKECSFFIGRQRLYNTKSDHALLMASANGHQGVVEVLYDHPQVHDYSGGQVAFLLAAYRQHLSIVQWLAEKELGMKETRFLEPLKSIAQKGSDDVVKILAELSMGIEIKDVELLRAFANAAGNGLETAVHVLKDSHVVKNSKAKYESGETPLHKAAAGGHLNIVKEFINNEDFDINTPSEDFICFDDTK
ncbi:hypothetical protein H0H87_003925 [Tephrocybe sp. NHM501043]|nr:hypothetical protein H0H87_003925 [Tephrocybe sp. NHM501043]